VAFVCKMTFGKPSSNTQRVLISLVFQNKDKIIFYMLDMFVTLKQRVFLEVKT